MRGRGEEYSKESVTACIGRAAADGSPVAISERQVMVPDVTGGGRVAADGEPREAGGGQVAADGGLVAADVRQGLAGG